MKMKIFTVIGLLLLGLSSSFCEEIDKVYESIEFGYDTITLSDRKFVYQNKTGLAIGDYVYPEVISGISKSEISYYGMHFLKSSDGANDIFYLAGDGLLICYYRDDNRNHKIPFFIGCSSDKKIYSIFSPVSETLNKPLSSSFLQEGTKLYTVDNLWEMNLDLPWVEGVSGQGYGEYLEFTLKSDTYRKAKGVYLLNGYISWDKPYLYEQNSRVKTIALEDVDTGDLWNIELIDTAAPQLIDCPGIEGHRIRLSIVDIYAGSKYEDTCIAGIILYN